MISWYLAEAGAVPLPRERRIVAWAGFMPDVDVLAYIAAIVYYRFDKDLAYENVWSVVHHRYTHNLSFVLLVGFAAYWLASAGRGAAGRMRVAGLAMAACALHNFLDLVGGGPTWPIYPLWPLSDFKWHAAWSWTIGDWPNVAILVACLAGMLAYGRAVGRSPLECFGDRADRWMVGVLRQQPASATPSGGKLRWLIWGAVILGALAILAPLGFNPFR